MKGGWGGAVWEGAARLQAQNRQPDGGVIAQTELHISYKEEELIW